MRRGRGVVGEGRGTRSSMPRRHALALSVAVLALVVLASGAMLAPGPRTGAHAAGAPPSGNGAPALRVCADPNNLPFSNEREEGFENRLADLVAREMGRRVEYTWWAQRRGFFRNTLNARLCDVVLGVPATLEMVLTTAPYYRSTYVFVTREEGPRVRSFDEDILRRVKVGVQLIGDDFASTPPAHALANRGITDNIVGFTVYGDYGQPNPPARIVHAVATGEVDIAVVWGPLAGYFATREAVPLRIVPVAPEADAPFLPFTFEISMGVRRGETALRDTLNAIIARRGPAIERLLDEYGVPRVGAHDAAM